MTDLSECQPWSKPGGAHGALVLHGFTGCPQSMRPLAEAFADAGFSVEMPLLPGHGTTVEDMVHTGWNDWSAAAESAYRSLAERCEKVVVAGLSMGGSLTVWLASQHPEIAGIVCVNPALRIGDDMVQLVQQMIESGEETIPSIGGDLADPDAHEAAYDAAPLRPLLTFAEGLAALRADLEKVLCPLLLLTSPQDHIVPPADSDELAVGAAGPVERIALERSYHVATVDYDRDLIRKEAVTFARRVTGAS
ncbi:MAG TPA: alpha/beta fold hydrolase [Acidimicrobiales bacterium]|jgi:carboxylesterase